MAEATAGKGELFKGIRWYDGFVVALANPGFLMDRWGTRSARSVDGVRSFCGRSLW